MRTKLSLIGTYAEGMSDYGGQPIKTRNLIQALKESNNNVYCIDMHNWKKRPFRIFIKTIYAFFTSNNIIIMPARNGIGILARLFYYLKRIKKVCIHYVVIGGWLHTKIDEDHKFSLYLKSVDWIYVETNVMKKRLEERNFQNALLFRNFKLTEPIKEDDIKRYLSSPIKVCTFSRVIEKKGILDAIEVVSKINADHGKKLIELDIYGQIYDGFEEKLYKYLENARTSCKYIGIVENDESNEVLRKYDLLLFPTQFYTEGIPGTLIDAYYSGLPILASRWESFDELIIEGESGYGYEFLNKNDFYSALLNIIEDKDTLLRMKHNAYKLAELYYSENAIVPLLGNLK